MNFSLNWKEDGNKPISLAISIIAHAALFFFLAYVLNLSVKSSAVNSGYVQVSTYQVEREKIIDDKNAEEEIEKEDNLVDEIEEPEELIEQPPEETPEIETEFLTYSDSAADTTGLENVYRESTLNVSIKYPPGWTYIDQNVKKKLDAVTFWSASSQYNPPPYIFLEVKEKYLFNPSRYEYNIELKNEAVAYFNEPEELEGQVSQIFYIRTDDDEDYSLKLIINGTENFKSFQPLFFGMLKTFKFGESFF